MKLHKLLLLTVLTLISLSYSTQESHAVTRGEKYIGISTGYNTRNESAVAGIFLQYNLSRSVRIAPDITYIFRNDRRDGLAFNVDLQLPIHIDRYSRANVFPLVGLNYTSWNMHPRTPGPIADDNDDVTTRTNKLGMNVGVGFDFQATKSLKFFIESRFVGARHYCYGAVTLGLGYIF